MAIYMPFLVSLRLLMFVGFMVQKITGGIIELIGVCGLFSVVAICGVRVDIEIYGAIAVIGVNVTSVVLTHTTPRRP
jgi:hypothetical protein